LKNYLFVYGTLMSGFDNPFASVLRSKSTLVGEGYFTGRLYRIGWYPGAVYLPEDKNKSRVFGEIYQIHEFADLIKKIDVYEEMSEDETVSLYLRKIIPVHQPDGSLVSCWTYLYNQPLQDLTLIKSGRFTTT